MSVNSRFVDSDFPVHARFGSPSMTQSNTGSDKEKRCTSSRDLAEQLPTAEPGRCEAESVCSVIIGLSETRSDVSVNSSSIFTPFRSAQSQCFRRCDAIQCTSDKILPNDHREYFDASDNAGDLLQTMSSRDVQTSTSLNNLSSEHISLQGAVTDRHADKTSTYQDATYDEELSHLYSEAATLKETEDLTYKFDGICHPPVQSEVTRRKFGSSVSAGKTDTPSREGLDETTSEKHDCVQRHSDRLEYETNDVTKQLDLKDKQIEELNLRTALLEEDLRYAWAFGNINGDRKQFSSVRDTIANLECQLNSANKHIKHLINYQSPDRVSGRTHGGSEVDADSGLRTVKDAEQCINYLQDQVRKLTAEKNRMFDKNQDLRDQLEDATREKELWRLLHEDDKSCFPQSFTDDVRSDRCQHRSHLAMLRYELNDTIQSHKSETKKLQADLDAMKTRYDEVTGDLMQADVKVTELTGDLQKMTVERNNIRNHYEREGLGTAYDAVMAHHASIVHNLQSEISQWRKYLSKKYAELDEKAFEVDYWSCHAHNLSDRVTFLELKDRKNEATISAFEMRYGDELRPDKLIVDTRPWEEGLDEKDVKRVRMLDGKFYTLRDGDITKDKLPSFMDEQSDMSSWWRSKERLANYSGQPDGHHGGKTNVRQEDIKDIEVKGTLAAEKYHLKSAMNHNKRTRALRVKTSLLLDRTFGKVD